jgi:hypothetical protein
MKKNIISVALVVLIASGAIIAGAYAFRSMSLKTLSPEETVLSFYSDWINYEGNPLAEKDYQENNYLSNSFKDELDIIINSFDKTAYDPILCAQDFPSEIKILNSSIKDDKAVVSTQHIFSGGNKIIELSLIDNNGWKIDDIICEEGESGSEVFSVIKSLVSDYIKNNISDLSPEKEVLGGKFFVTSIRFIDSNICVVDYEDGHIALTAEVKFNVPKASEVEIESFEIIEDDKMLEFIEIGNVTEENNQWYLVYEKLGEPALRVELLFDDNSKCSDQRADNSCLPVYWQVGDRVEIKGILENGEVKVKTFRVIGEDSKDISGGESEEINSFSDCVNAGYEALYPDCVDCLPYCETSDGSRFEKESAYDI